MKILRAIALIFLYFVVFLVTMALTAMCFRPGWQYGLGLLGGIWLAYFLCLLWRWNFVSTLFLVAFLGYATGLLKESDKYTTQAQAEFVSWLPSHWVGLAGMAFFCIFVVVLPVLASFLADKCRAKFKPVVSVDDPSINSHQ